MTRLHSGLMVGPHRARKYVSAPLQAEEPPGGVTAPENLPPAEATTIKALLDWIGDDKDRGQTVLDLETAKSEDDRRSTLVKQLEEFVNSDLI